MKDNDYVMYIIMEYEKERKEKEALKKVMKNKKSNVDIEGEKGKDQSISVEKKNIDKEQKRDTNEKAAKQEATIDNIKDNVGIHLSCGPKLGLEPIDELVNEVIETSDKKDDVIQEKLQKVLLELGFPPLTMLKVELFYPLYIISPCHGKFFPQESNLHLMIK
ncbi:hypothetical protein P3L10_018707 [Capsicum annuum]